MTTITDIARDPLIYMASFFSLSSLVSFGRCSKKLKEISTEDKLWRSFMERLSLVPNGTPYETVKNFYLRFNEASRRTLPKPTSLVGQLGSFCTWLVSTPVKTTLFDQNIDTWKNLSLEERTDAIDTTSKQDGEIALHLSQTGPYHKDAEAIPGGKITLHGCLIRIAVEIGSIKIFNALLQYGPINTTERGIAVMIAVGNNRIELLKLLLKEPIAERHFDQSLDLAVSLGQFTICQELLKTSPLSEKRKKILSEAALSKGHHDIVKWLSELPTLV